ncbi:MAG: hypothetical protein EBX52_04605 [Proteobacteria bacterium]|nr:hypothetical protein [Pseudomonadota bacterium]
MKPEKRIKNEKTAGKPSELPLDFLRLVNETLTQALDAGLAEIKKIHPESAFSSQGYIYDDEIVLSISLTHGAEVLSATTVHSSISYLPGQEKPTVNELLALCVDSAGIVFQHYLDPAFPERVAQIAESSLGALEDAPFEWSPIEVTPNQKTIVHVKMDKSNPVLDRLAEDWLKKHDPEYHKSNPDGASTEVHAAEEFLEERIEAIRAAKSGSGPGFGGSGQNGPIKH